MNKKDFGNYLKKMRIEKELSIEFLAKRTGFTTRAINYWENGERAISLINADILLKELGEQIIIGKEFITISNKKEDDKNKK